MGADPCNEDSLGSEKPCLLQSGFILSAIVKYVHGVVGNLLGIMCSVL